MPQSGEQWTDKHYAAAKLAATLQELIALQETQVHFIGLEGDVAGSVSLDFHTDVGQQLNLIVYISNVGDILYANRLTAQ